MKIGIQQPEHLPWIGFFNKMTQVDIFVFLDHVQYKKQYFENRNKIKSPNGPKWVTVPVKKNGKLNPSILEMGIDSGDQKWKRRYLSNIELAYKQAPFWRDVRNLMWPIFEKPLRKLVDLNLDLIQGIAEYLNIRTETIRSSLLTFSDGQKSDLNLNICKALGATVYLSGPAGKEYLDQFSFRKEGIKVKFHDFQSPEYPQLFGGFQSNMSVIDLIANSGPESQVIVRNCYRVHELVDSNLTE